MSECVLCRRTFNSVSSPGNLPPPWFIWTTSRYFDFEKFLNIIRDSKRRVSLYEDGNPVCILCVDKYGLMDNVPLKSKIKEGEKELERVKRHYEELKNR